MMQAAFVRERISVGPYHPRDRNTRNRTDFPLKQSEIRLQHSNRWCKSAFVGEGTPVVYLDPARINQETETREIGREDITICYQPDSFYKLDMKDNKYTLDMELKLVHGHLCMVRIPTCSQFFFLVCRFFSHFFFCLASCGFTTEYL